MCEYLRVHVCRRNEHEYVCMREHVCECMSNHVYASSRVRSECESRSQHEWLILRKQVGSREASPVNPTRDQTSNVGQDMTSSLGKAPERVRLQSKGERD